MKTKLPGATLAAVAALSIFGCAGCANEKSVTTTDSSATANPTDRTYSQKDLRQTGRTQTGDAVKSLEPATR